MKKININNKLNEIFEMKIGRILNVHQGHTKKEEDKRLFAKIEVFPSGTFDNVPFWGGGFDLNTEMPHGIFSIPRENQLIIIFFINGYFNDPVGVCPIPHPYDGSFVDKYYNLIENINDISIFHFSGSRIIIREDGSIDIQKRIEESIDNFVNHTLKIEFEYDSGNNLRKKTITDIDNDVIIEIDGDDVNITDSADQFINMHHKTGENKLVFQRSGSQKIELNNTKDQITGPALDLLGATESFVKGDTLETQLNIILTALQTFSTGLNPTTLAAQSATLATAIGTALGILNQIKSTTIKGE